MFIVSLYRCILLYHCTYGPDVTTLGTLQAKRTYISKDLGLLGEWFPMFRRYVGNHWPNDMVSYPRGPGY